MNSGDSEYSDGVHSDSGDGPTRKSSRSKKSKKSSQNGGYRIKNALKVPRATTYTAQALYDQIHSSDIDLDPEYQRAVVWPEAKQIGIIDSIFRNFYIPPVIFCVTAHDDGSETKTCIDGKQRLTSIHRFMDGLIPHKDPLTNDKYWYKDAGSAVKGARTRRILPEKYRRLFANKQIVCVEYQDITDGDEREIFQRVQLGMALTPAEKIQVISSPRAAFVRELQTKFLDSNGLVGADFEWDNSRGSDFRCIAQTILAIEKYPHPQSVTLAPLEKWLAQPDAVIEKSFRDRIHKVYQTWLELIGNETLKKAFQSPSKVAPIEFVLIGLLISVLMDTMSLPQLSQAIRGMRDDVRAKHVDIRLNDRVGRCMLDFIKGLAPKTTNSSTAPEGSGEVNLEASLKRKRDENEVAVRKTVKKETAETPNLSWAGPSGTNVANRPTPQPTQRTSMQPIVVPPTATPPISGSPFPNSLPIKIPWERLATVQQAKQQAAAAERAMWTTPPSSFSAPNRNFATAGTSQPGTPSMMMPPPPRQQQPQQTYASLQDSLVASLSNNSNGQEGYGGGSGGLDNAASQSQRWDHGDPSGWVQRAVNNRGHSGR